MHMKEDILAMWKSTFISSADSRIQGSTLEKTFIPRGPAPPSSVPHGPGGGSGTSAVSSLVFKPLAPPPGIPLMPRLSHYLQDPLTTSFPAMGPPAEYNFDPITGQPLKASTPDIFSRSSQLRDISVPTSASPRVMGLLNLPGLSQEEHPLVVGPPSRPSRVVVGERMPTVTVLSSIAKTTLSSLPNMAPRISTSSSNVTGEDVHRVIQQYPTSSPSRALVGVGVGRGSTRRPTKRSAGRGQGLAGMLMDSASSAGRGRSTPSPPVGRSQQGERQASTCIESGLPPAVTMQLDHQGPMVTYLEATLQATLESCSPSPQVSPGQCATQASSS